MKTLLQAVVPVAVANAVKVAAKAVAAVATDFNMLFVETVCTPSLPCFDKTLWKNRKIYDFSPEFSILKCKMSRKAAQL